MILKYFPNTRSSRHGSPELPGPPRRWEQGAAEQRMAQATAEEDWPALRQEIRAWSRAFYGVLPWFSDRV